MTRIKVGTAAAGQIYPYINWRDKAIFGGLNHIPQTEYMVRLPYELSKIGAIQELMVNGDQYLCFRREEDATMWLLRWSS